MTKAQRAQLMFYLERCQRELHLCDWAIALLDEPSPDDAHADIEVTESCNAQLRLEVRFFERTPEMQRRILVHELCHLHTARVRASPTLLEGSLSQSPFNIFTFHVETIEEELVERLARLVEQLLPLPRFSRAKEPG